VFATGSEYVSGNYYGSFTRGDWFENTTVDIITDA
jgi:hypothetical protein